MSFKSKSLLRRDSVNNKNKLDTLIKSWVYHLTCSNCNSQCISRTNMDFSDRIREHTHLSLRSSSGFSQFSLHVLNTGHIFDKETGFKVWHKVPKGKVMNKLEMLEIMRFRHTIDYTRYNQFSDIQWYTSDLLYFIQKSNCTVECPFMYMLSLGKVELTKPSDHAVPFQLVFLCRVNYPIGWHMDTIFFFNLFGLLVFFSITVLTQDNIQWFVIHSSHKNIILE